jgi:DNA-binding transcriptional LysR family regulator
MIQMNDPLETAELLAFARVVDAKSLSRAAAELGVPRATIGRRLARLEQRLGTRLLRRTTRSLALTEAGELFYRQARIVLEAVAQAQSTVRETGEVMRGVLRLSIPPANDDALAAVITSFAKEHPDVRLQVNASTRIVDLLREGYDLALRASMAISPGLIARTILREKVIAVASPEYLAKYGMPRGVKELRKHRCLTGFARGELPQGTWRVGRSEVHVESAFSSNDLVLLREAAARGVGIALLPTFLVSQLLETGALVKVLPGVIDAETRLAVVYPEREFLPRHVRAFIDALVQWSPVQPAFGASPGSRSLARRRRGSSNPRRAT